MPLFTRENAAEMGRRSAISRKNIARERALHPVENPLAALNEHQKRLCEQIDILDSDISRTRKPEVRCKLIAAKAKLWRLLYPETGTRQGKHRDRAPAFSPGTNIQPVVNPAPIVAPIIEPNHNEQIIQSQSAA